jgi:hypothetical protein
VEIAAFLSSCFLHLCFPLRSSPSLFCCLSLLLLASSSSSFAPESVLLQIRISSLVLELLLKSHVRLLFLSDS